MVNRYANTRVFSFTANNPRTHVIPRRGRTAMEATTSFLQRKKSFSVERAGYTVNMGTSLAVQVEILNYYNYVVVIMCVLPQSVHFAPTLSYSKTLQMNNHSYAV